MEKLAPRGQLFSSHGAQTGRLKQKKMASDRLQPNVPDRSRGRSSQLVSAHDSQWDIPSLRRLQSAAPPTSSIQCLLVLALFNVSLASVKGARSLQLWEGKIRGAEQ